MMIRFAPNFYHMFLELPVRERFAAAAKIGCSAIEWHFPYELPKDELKQLLDDNGLEFTYGVVPADWDAGVWGLGAQPGQEDDFRRAADQALDYITHCDFYSINVGAGTVPDGVERQRCVDTYVHNLDYIASQAGDHRCLAEAAGIVRAVGRDNVGLVYDTFHLRWEEQGPLTAIMDDYWPMIGYVQIGNPPDRHEPGVGELDLLYLVDRAIGKG
jgi:hydroxypyruvate isomerase